MMFTRLSFILLYSCSLFAMVQTQELQKGTLNSTQTFNGSLNFNQQSRLAAESDGLITHIYIDEGDKVKKGDILLQLDTQVLTANIKSTQASINELQLSVDEANNNLLRYQKLYEQESVSKQQYDNFYFKKMQLEQKLLSLKATLTAQTIEKRKKSLRAPFDGYIAARGVEVGEWLKAGNETFLLVNPNTIDITFHLPSEYIQESFNTTDIALTINKKAYKAKVISHLLIGDEKTRTFPLKLRLIEPRGNFFNGMQANITLQRRSYNDVYIISRDALIKKFGQNVIFVDKNNTAQMIPVTILGYEEDKVAITSDQLQMGDDVIVKGNERLFPNQKIDP